MAFEKIEVFDDSHDVFSPLSDLARDEILQQLRAGTAEMWRCPDGCGYLVTRIEGTELVIVCAVGRNARGLVPKIVAAASNQGLRSIRFHTERPALARLVRMAGFRLSEYVFRAELK